jgi:hypothetical protein
MKHTRIVFCLALLVLMALPTGAWALSVGNPSKSGSLIIFPLIDLSNNADTVISISNEMYYDVNVFCQYRSEVDDVGGSVFTIGPRGTVWFSLKDGSGSIPAPFTIAERGEVKCWAVNESGSQQISWNYLQGFAEITDAVGNTWGYSSWNFAADQPRGNFIGDPGEIKLTGLPGGYDAMPKYLRFNVPGTVSEAKVTLVLGKQDLRQDREKSYSKAKFSYTKYGTSSTQCVIDQGQVPIRNSLIGTFTVQGIASTVCDEKYGIPYKTTKNSPLLGVIVAKRTVTYYGIMPVGVGADGSGYILWDPDYMAEKRAR